MAKRYVYVEQFGGWWRLTTDEWRAVLEKGSASQGYDLSQYRELAGRPSCIRTGMTASDLWIDHPRHLFYQPLDWQPEQHEDALRKLNEIEQRDKE